MLLHENRLPAENDSREIPCLICYFFKQWQILKSSSAANYRRRFMGYKCMHSSLVGLDA